MDLGLPHGLEPGDPLFGLINPLSDILQGLESTLPSAIGQLAAPVLGTVGSAVETVLSQVAAPLVGTVGSVVETVLDQVAAPLVGTVGSAVETVLDQVAAPLVGAAGSAVETVLSQVAAPVSGIAGALGGALEVVASGGSVPFHTGPLGGGLALDDLFTGNHYTDYNLALQSAPAGSTAIQTSHSAAAEMQTQLDHILDEGSGGHGAGHGHGGSLNVTLPGILDDIVHRSLGDGIV